MEVKYNFLKKTLLVIIVIMWGKSSSGACVKDSVKQDNTKNNLEYNHAANTTAYHNAKMIPIANPRPLVSRNKKSLIGTSTETWTQCTPPYGDTPEIIVLSTPAGTPFFQKETDKLSAQNTKTTNNPAFLNYQVEVWLKADEIQNHDILPNNTPVALWENLSESGNHFVQSVAAKKPQYSYDGMNFHPTVKFRKVTASADINTLTSQSDLVTEANTNRVYRSFYVSTPHPEGLYSNSTYGAVFAYRSGVDEGWYGNTSSNYLYYNATTFNPGLGEKRYGITSMNRAGTVWHNAKSGSAAASAITAGKGKAFIGTRLTAPALASSFFGDIQEIIILSTPVGTPFDIEKIAQINTYLAVKYGQMLDSTAHPVWKNSGGEEIWNTAHHAGYNKNIFGIGRDDLFGLYQKQSMSVGSREQITVFTGNDVQPGVLNSQNNGALDDGFFLMLGSNGKAPNNAEQIEYKYNTGTIFANGDTLALNLDFRHPTVLKAHLTGATSFTTNLYLGAIKADYLLVSNNPDFAPSSTRIYFVDKSMTVLNVPINQDEYIGFAYQEKIPGGVGNSLVMWLKADELSTLDLVDGKLRGWRDFYGNPNDISYYYQRISTSDGYYTSPPSFISIDPDLNFHPAVNFNENTATTGTHSTADRDYLITDRAPFSRANPESYTVVTVFRLRNIHAYGAQRCHYLGFGSHQMGAANRHPVMGFEATNYGNVGRIYRESDGNAYNGNSYLFKEGAATIAMYINKNTAPYYIQFEADGYQDRLAAVIGDNQMMNAKGTLGCGAEHNRALVGTIGEMIAYETLLEDYDKQKLYSYLALKYGMTLDEDKTTTSIAYDYLMSDGTVVWSGNHDSLHQRYHNNIAALVRDKSTELNNMQSHSTNIGSAILMGIGKRLGVNPNLTGLNNDKEVIIWGNNGEDFATTTFPPAGATITTDCGNFEEIVTGRIWMVDVLTQENYTVLMGAGDQGFNEGNNKFPYGAGYEVTLLMADSEEKIQNLEWDYAIPGIWVDKLHQFNITFEAGKRYFFTFGAKQVEGDCEPCNLTNRFKTITFNTKTWKNGATSSNFILNNQGFKVNIGAAFEGTGNARFCSTYPRSYATALRMNRCGNSEQKMTTVIELDTAATAFFDLRKVDYFSSRYTNVAVYGECGSGKVIPELNYATTQKRSYYQIDKEVGKAVTMRRVHAGNGDRNAWMLVNFDKPVNKIVIEHTLTGKSGNLLKYFLLGPVHLACPAPPPPINEDGFSLSQQAIPQEVRLCEQVTYTWRIQNANCSEKTGDFTVTLAQGMLWETNSLSIQDYNIENAEINHYGSNNTLTINNLTLSPGENIFRARAYFEMDASDGEYSNTANINYAKIVNNVVVPGFLSSCNRTSLGCEPTTVAAISAPDRIFPLEIINYFTNKSDYAQNDTIQTTIVMNNPNATPITQTAFDIIYNEEFTYQKGSLTSDISGMGAPDFYVDEDTGLPFSGFTLKGATGAGFAIPPGEHTITFKVIAPATLESDYNSDGTEMLDENDNPVHPSLNIVFDFSTLSEEDDCSAAVFYNAYGDITLSAPWKCEFEISNTGSDELCISGITQLLPATSDWVSSNPSVATVDDAGLVTAIASGTVTLTYTGKTCNTKTTPQELQITVKQKLPMAVDIRIRK